MTTDSSAPLGIMLVHASPSRAAVQGPSRYVHIASTAVSCMAPAHGTCALDQLQVPLTSASSLLGGVTVAEEATSIHAGTALSSACLMFIFAVVVPAVLAQPPIKYVIQSACQHPQNAMSPTKETACR